MPLREGDADCRSAGVDRRRFDRGRADQRRAARHRGQEARSSAEANRDQVILIATTLANVDEAAADSAAAFVIGSRGSTSRRSGEVGKREPLRYEGQRDALRKKQGQEVQGCSGVAIRLPPRPFLCIPSCVVVPFVPSWLARRESSRAARAAPPACCGWPRGRWVRKLPFSTLEWLRGPFGERHWRGRFGFECRPLPTLPGFACRLNGGVL